MTAARALFAAALAVAGCHHDKGNGSTTKAHAPVTDLSLLPADAEAVFGIDFDKLRQSALWKQYEPQMQQAAASGIAKFKALCGFDPIASMKSVAIGIKNLDGDATGAIVVRGFDKKQSITCFDKDIGDIEKDGTKVTIDGDVILVTDKQGKKLGFTFVDEYTALVAFGPEASSKETLRAAASGANALDKSASFVDIYNKLNHNDSVWMVMNGNAPVFQKTGMPYKIVAMFGTMNVTDGLTVDGRLRLGTAEEATGFVNQFKGQLEQAKGFVDRADLSSEGADVKLAVAIGHDKLVQMVGMFGGMLARPAHD